MTLPFIPGPGHIDEGGSHWSADVALDVEPTSSDGDTVATLHLYTVNIEDDSPAFSVEGVGIELTRGDLVILIDRLMDVAREIGLPLREPDPPRARCGRYDPHGPHTGGPGSGVWCVGNLNVIVALTEPDEPTPATVVGDGYRQDEPEWIDYGGEA